MTRKPILFHKIMTQGHGRVREVIGLIGTHHGAGVTHTGLMLAFYMGEELGRKTALLECNSHHDLGRLQEAYEWHGEVENSFSFHSITCYKEVATEQIPMILGNDFDCLILDFGVDFKENKEEFLRCTTKIIIGGRASWEQPRIRNFVCNLEAISGNDAWMCFIPLADNRTAIKIKKEIKRKVWSVPYVYEPTRSNNMSYQFFKGLFPIY